MNKIRIVIAILFFVFIFGCSTSEKQSGIPNVIIIFNDDQGYQDLGCFGSPDIKTPRVDQMAKEGMLFTDFYVASSVCSASRAALLTGCYPQRVGVSGVFFPNNGHVGLNPEHTTIAEVLKSVSYATAAIGKWHLGDLPEFLPTNQGFDMYYGIPYSNDMYPARDMKYAENCIFRENFTTNKLEETLQGVDPGKQPRGLKNKVPLMRNEECIEFPCDQTTITRRYTDEGLKFISENAKKDKPFFLYIANTMPHIPLFASEDFRGKSERGLYGDVIEEIDYNTGRILDQLKELGIEENTIVIFTSDNGPWLEVGKDKSGRADPLFEGKFTSFEGGMRVPFIIKWPGKIPAGSNCTELAASIDLLPTLAKIAGAELPEKELDGKDIYNLWTAEQGAKTPHEYFYYVFMGEAVRSGDWKYHKKEIYRIKETERESKGPSLYNLKSDIEESRNVIDQYPEIAKRLSNALEEHLNKLAKGE